MDKAPVPYEVRRVLSTHEMRGEIRHSGYVESGCLDAPHVILCGSAEAVQVDSLSVTIESCYWRP